MAERRDRFPWISLLLAVLALGGPLAQAAAQEAAPEDATRTEVFAPFVSRLRLAISDPRVRVSWEDAADIETRYRIYRSTSPITNETLDDAELVARVDPGTEGYIDLPPERGAYYYAVIAETTTGGGYRVVIPGRNASVRPVEITSIATDEQRAAEVTRITADVVLAEGRSAIEVTAVADRTGRTLAIYRSTDPIVTVEDLERASLVRQVASGEIRIVDLPVPGVPYYYAAVDAELLIADTVSVTPGRNATAEPAEIPIVIGAETPVTDSLDTVDATDTVDASAEVAGAEEPIFEPAITAVRGLPLPFLQLQSELATGVRLQDPRILIPEPRALDSRTAADTAAILSTVEARTVSTPEPTVLSEDRMPEPEGAEYTLRTILEGPFSRMAWESALVQLNNFFTLPLSPELEARAHFYRAQVYYFLGDRQRAILELLLARDRHFVEVEGWLDRVLSAPGA